MQEYKIDGHLYTDSSGNQRSVQLSSPANILVLHCVGVSKVLTHVYIYYTCYWVVRRQLSHTPRVVRRQLNHTQ